MAALLVAPIGSRLHASTPAPGAAAPTVQRPSGCIGHGVGFLRARLRGASTLDLNWRDADMLCEGAPRPDGRGVRVSIAGPESADGRRLRFVFGISGAREGAPGRALPTNVTVIFEGEQRLYATRGDDKCTIDELRQQRIAPLGGPQRAYRVLARGFCTGPAADAQGSERLLVTSFDFAGRVSYGGE